MCIRDRLYTVKHSTEDTTQRGTVPKKTHIKTIFLQVHIFFNSLRYYIKCFKHYASLEMCIDDLKTTSYIKLTQNANRTALVSLKQNHGHLTKHLSPWFFRKKNIHVNFERYTINLNTNID